MTDHADTGLPPGGRVFETGASRNSDKGKLDFEAYLSPTAIRRYAEYMRDNASLDGEERSGDNWQKGMPREAYAKSLWRHFYDVWAHHRGLPPLDATHDIEEALCAVLFNTFGMLHEVLKEQAEANDCKAAAEAERLAASYLPQCACAHFRATHVGGRDGCTALGCSCPNYLER